MLQRTGAAERSLGGSPCGLESATEVERERAQATTQALLRRYRQPNPPALDDAVPPLEPTALESICALCAVEPSAPRTRIVLLLVFQHVTLRPTPRRVHLRLEWRLRAVRGCRTRRGLHGGAIRGGGGRAAVWAGG